MEKMEGAMDEVTPRERILKRIRESLTQAPVLTRTDVDLESGIYSRSEDPDEVAFAESFIGNRGNFIYCENIRIAMRTLVELVQEQQWEGKIFCKDAVVEDLLRLSGLNYDSQPVDAVLKSVVFTGCRYLVAQDGSILWDSSAIGRRAMAQADVLVFIASVEQIVPDFRTVLRMLKGKKEDLPSFLSRWTGLSRFIDIDGQPIRGMGPEKILLVLIDNL